MTDEISACKTESYKIYCGDIPNDNYEVASVVQDAEGTRVSLCGKKHAVEVVFGAVESLCVCDEGTRLRSYNEISDIQAYRGNNFNGNPFYIVENSRFKNWLLDESCGFSQSLLHFAVITINDFIDIAAAFPPKIFIEQGSDI